MLRTPELIRRLTTAQVLYYMPDHPGLLQEFWWQTLDELPSFPRVHRFLNFWRAEVLAPIHSVTLTVAGFERPVDLRLVKMMGNA